MLKVKLTSFLYFGRTYSLIISFLVFKKCSLFLAWLWGAWPWWHFVWAYCRWGISLFYGVCKCVRRSWGLYQVVHFFDCCTCGSNRPTSLEIVAFLWCHFWFEADLFSSGWAADLQSSICLRSHHCSEIWSDSINRLSYFWWILISFMRSIFCSSRF